MEEVPASPESVRQPKPRRKTNFSKRCKRTSLIRERNSADNPDNPECPSNDVKSLIMNTTEVVNSTESEVNSVKQSDIHLLYFDDDSDIEFVNEDPLASAKILEKANQIEPDFMVQHSEEFLMNIRNKFVKIKDLLEPDKDSGRGEIKQEINVSYPEKANYSYTQFDLNTEMMGVCEAADVLASLNNDPIDGMKGWKSPLKEEVCEKISEVPAPVDLCKSKNRWSNIRQCSFSRDSIEIAGGCKTSGGNEDLKRMIVTDFSDDETEEGQTVDFSKIESVQLRQRLRKIQCYIDSPPQSVNKSNSHRTYPRKKQSCKSPRTPVVRRLSYENKDFSSDDEVSLADSFESLEMGSVDEKPHEIKRGSDYDLVSSFLIKENLRQLSQIYSHSIISQDKDEQGSDSLNREPPFNGFSSQSPSSILLRNSGSNESLHILHLDWLFRSDSESERECCVDMDEHSSDEVHRLLDDDDDFLVQLNPSPQNTEFRTEESERDVVNPNLAETTEPTITGRCTSPSAHTESDHKPLPSEHRETSNSIPSTSAVVGFQTASGSSIRISEKALATARSIWAAEETKFDVDEQRRSIPDRDACAPASTEVVPPFVGFSTAAGSKIAVSEDALEKAKALWNDFEDSTKNEMVSNEALAKNGAVPRFVGFSTAGGSTIAVSKGALRRAEALWNDFEDSSKDEMSQNKAPRFVGFSTAGGSVIPVSERALDNAKTLWNDFEDPLGHKNASNKILAKKQEVVSGFVGFSTAGGSKITVSEGALEKAKALWNDFDDSSKDKIAKNNVLPGTFASRDETNEHIPMSTEDVSQLVGFSTAGGRTITVSKDALESAKALWNNFEDLSKEEIASNEVLAKKVEFRNETLKRVPDEDCDPKTPSKRFKPNNAVNGIGFSTSTPNIPLKGPNPNGQQADEIVAIEQFFADLDDQEFQHMLCDNESVSTNAPRTRPLKQVCLINRFEESNRTETNLSGVIQWDDSFGEVVVNLSPGFTDWLKPSQHILEARKHARQLQLDYIKTKPDSERKPSLSEFVEKKLQSERCSIQEFVGNSKPVPADVKDIPERIRMLTTENVIEFKFDMVTLYGRGVCLENIDGFPLGNPDAIVNLILDDHCQAGLLEISSAFLAAPGIDPALVPEGWIENAWKWIVLKLASMERNLSTHFNAIITPDNVYNQLLYRYHVEINCVKRSVIRKILEKDDIPNKRMVLFVSRVFRTQNPFEAEIELSDGWYALRAILDPPLITAICNEKIVVGTKLMIQGAELVNLTEGCSPFQIPNDVRLRIHANSTRRAKWFCKLGLYKVPRSFLISCNHVLDNGGLITRLQLLVIRVYPMLYVDKASNGDGSVLRSERAERRYSLANDASRFENFHTLFSQIQKEIEAEKSEKVRKSKSLLYKSASTAELLEMIDAGLDISCIEIDISATQREVILDHQRRRQEECLQEINRRVKERMNGQSSRRNVTRLLKVRVMDARTPDKILLLSIWRPPEDLTEIIQESKMLEVGNAKANGTRNGELQLIAGTTCSYNVLKGPQIRFPIKQFRKLTKLAEIDHATFRPQFNEFDTIGVVIQVGDFEPKKFQQVYIADLSMNLLCVNFWSGIREFAYEDVVKQRTVICITNLQWRTISTLSVIPNAFTSECTVYSESSNADHFIDELRNFHSSFAAIDTELFYNQCLQKIQSFKDRKLSRTSSNNTPLQQSRNHHESSTVNCSTPLRPALSSINSIDNTRTDFSPNIGQPVSLQKRKIEQLSAAYKSPPKLSPIIMRSNPRVRKSFKIPARLDSRIEQTYRNNTLE